jgi:hypothetical protein
VDECQWVVVDCVERDSSDSEMGTEWWVGVALIYARLCDLRQLIMVSVSTRPIHAAAARRARSDLSNSLIRAGKAAQARHTTQREARRDTRRDVRLSGGVCTMMCCEAQSAGMLAVHASQRMLRAMRIVCSVHGRLVDVGRDQCVMPSQGGCRSGTRTPDRQSESVFCNG